MIKQLIQKSEWYIYFLLTLAFEGGSSVQEAWLENINWEVIYKVISSSWNILGPVRRN